MQLPASATLADAPDLLKSLETEMARDGGGSGPLRIDASALTSFDTSAIALLMQARRLAQAAGRPFEVVGAPAKLGELARLYGVEELLLLSGAASSVATPA